MPTLPKNYKRLCHLNSIFRRIHDSKDWKLPIEVVVQPHEVQDTVDAINAYTFTEISTTQLADLSILIKSTGHKL